MSAGCDKKTVEFVTVGPSTSCQYTCSLMFCRRCGPRLTVQRIRDICVKVVGASLLNSGDFQILQRFVFGWYWCNTIVAVLWRGKANDGIWLRPAVTAG